MGSRNWDLVAIPHGIPILLVATVGINKNLRLVSGVYLNAELPAAAHILGGCLCGYGDGILWFFGRQHFFPPRTNDFSTGFCFFKLDIIQVSPTNDILEYGGELISDPAYVLISPDLPRKLFDTQPKVMGTGLVMNHDGCQFFTMFFEIPLFMMTSIWNVFLQKKQGQGKITKYWVWNVPHDVSSNIMHIMTFVGDTWMISSLKKQ